MHLGKFINTKTGKIIMSILLGLGLASLFRTMCKNKKCLTFKAPSLEQIKDKIYKSNDKCVKYSYVPTKCNTHSKIIGFE